MNKMNRMRTAWEARSRSQTGRIGRAGDGLAASRPATRRLLAGLVLAAVLGASLFGASPLGVAPLRAQPAPLHPGEAAAEAAGAELGGAAEPAFSVLASYTFDEAFRGSPSQTSGPDTFRVFERARGSVTRTTHFRLSGEHSLELRDVAGDGDFPELMGFFELRESGQLYAHFAFLVVDPDQELNVAFIGPGGFRLAEDGFAFWLRSLDGVLCHVSDSMPKKLFRLEAFTWYLVDVLYDIDRGIYQLGIEEEGAAEPLVALADQPNAGNHPGSAVSTFSFVSDPFEDRSEVVYYVDDIVLGAERDIGPGRFVAPGRRKLFVEMQVEERRGRERERLQAVREAAGAVGETATTSTEPAPDPWLAAIAEGRPGDAYRQARGRLVELEAKGASESSGHRLRAEWLERAGDAALLAGDPALALELYDQALEVSGGEIPPQQLLKRADAHHLLGDAVGEKRLREAIYGTVDGVR